MTDALNYSATPPTPGHRLVAAVHAAALACPPLLLATFYGAWLLAWVTLGHPPRPSLDDPKAVLGKAYDARALAVLLLPVGMLAGVCSVVLVTVTYRAKCKPALRTIALVAVWTSAITLLRWDPLHVIDWWMD